MAHFQEHYYDFDDLEEFMEEGSVPACCSEGCFVEPDGECEHGFPSLLLHLGLV